MQTEVLFTVEHAPEGGFIARAVGYGIFVQAETTAELHARCATRSAATSIHRTSRD